MSVPFNSTDIQPSPPGVRLSSIMVGMAFACSTLWDFYFAGVRPLDFIAVFLLMGAVVVARSPRGEFIRGVDASAIVPLSLIGAIVAIYGVVGIASDTENAKPVVGVVLSVLAMFAITAGVPFSDRMVSITIRSLIVVHCTAQLLQAAVFYSSGQILNFHAVVGLEPRLLSSIFRPAGLFREPAIFSLAMILLLGIKTRLREPFDRYEGLALVCIVFSLSLWGIAAAAIYLLLFRRSLLVVVSVIVSGVILFMTDRTFAVMERVSVFFLTRIAGFSTDGSAQGRYGGIDVFFADPARYWEVLLGRGINNDFEQFGSAGFIFLLNSFGIIGSLSLVLCIVLLSRGVRASVLLLIGLTLTAAPIFTNVAWLSAIALMTVSRDKGTCSESRYSGK
jgi:hypothetical protein